MTSAYIARANRYVTCAVQRFASEAQLDRWINKESARTAPVLVLMDRRGVALSSEQFAEQMGRLRDTGVQTVVYAIGPADGWSAEGRARADHLVSFGPITLPHELASVVLAEQIYRALTILAGHPYHCGH